MEWKDLVFRFRRVMGLDARGSVTRGDYGTVHRTMIALPKGNNTLRITVLDRESRHDGE